MAILQKKFTTKITSFKIALPIIILVSLIFRFWLLPERFIFDIDTAYQSFFAKTILDHFHIIWIGVSASNTGYYLGPGLVYMTALLLWISKSDPIILGYFASFMGVLTTLSIFYIANYLYGSRVAILSALLYASSFFITSYDQRYWPIFIPLIAIWIFFGLMKSRAQPRWLILTVLLISLAYHIHLSLLIFWPFILWNFFRQLKKVDIFTWVGSITAYFTVTFPLLVFDFVHNFDNLRAPLKFIQSRQEVSEFNSHFTYVMSLINKILFVNIQNVQLITIFLTVISSLLIVYLIKNRKEHTLLSGVVVLFILLLSLYPGPLQEYYIVLLFPFWTLAAGLLLKKVPLKYVSFLLVLFLIVNFYSLITVLEPRGLSTKKNLVQTVSQYMTDEYFLDFEGDRDIEGWRYLFSIYGKKPAQSKTDSMFGWLYPQEISSTLPQHKVFITTKNTLYKNPVYFGRFGRYYAYILPN